MIGAHTASNPTPKLGSPEYRQVNERHIADPRPGDYWHEMFCPYFVVLGRIGPKVLICDTTKDVDADHWTWDLSKQSIVTVDELRERVAYKGIDGFCADCMPAAHLWAVEAVYGYA